MKFWTELLFSTTVKRQPMLPGPGFQGKDNRMQRQPAMLLTLVLSAGLIGTGCGSKEPDEV